MVSIEINNEYFAIFDLNSDISNAGFTNVWALFDANVGMWLRILGGKWNFQSVYGVHSGTERHAVTFRCDDTDGLNLCREMTIFKFKN